MALLTLKAIGSQHTYDIRRTHFSANALGYLLLLLLGSITITSSAQSTVSWTGTVSTDWNDPGNWDTNVPSAGDTLIIPNVTNQPVLNSATPAINSMTIQTDASLTINSSGQLYIAGDTTSIENFGTLNNIGYIEITKPINSRFDGIINHGTLLNSSLIIIFDGSRCGLQILAGSTFENTGNIYIEDCSSGMEIGVAFQNEGIIEIVGSSAFGLLILDNFTNTSSGEVTIDSGDPILGFGIYGGTFTNNGTIDVDGAETGMEVYLEAFINSATGEITISDTDVGIILGDGILTNSGNLSFANSSDDAIESTSTFTNNGLLGGEGNINLSTNDIGGTIAPGFSPGEFSFTNDIAFSANTTLSMEVENNTVGTFDRILGNGDIDISNATLDANISYTPPADDRVVILSASSITGTFQAISPALPNGWLIDYSIAGEVALEFIKALPVEWLSFEAATKGNDILLEWQTAAEVDNRGFEILHATDGKHWQVIGFVGGNNNSTGVQDYHFIHQQAATGTNYYQLRQLDYDGSFDYSAIRSVHIGIDTPTVTVYPNPATDYAQLSLLEHFEQGQLKLINQSGQVVLEQSLSAGRSSPTIQLSQLPTGNYLLGIQLDKQYVTRPLIHTQH